MLQSQFVRYFNRSVPTWSVAQKSQLAKLRKKTGYTFANCKKALEIKNNDLAEAEKWLNDQAEALGWSKLAKMEGRVTGQGLVGISFQDRNAAMVEINCETDFVARNKNFKEMVDIASKACLHTVKEPTMLETTKMWLDADSLKTVESCDGKSLSNHVALLVSSVGENVLLKRAVAIGVRKELNVACYVHPVADKGGNVMHGRYGAIIIYSAPKYNAITEQIARQLCQHVVGMNPKTIYKDIDEEKVSSLKLDKKPVKLEASNSDEEGEADLVENNETAMMAQDFLLDPILTVEEVLEGSGIKIHDFVRFQAGERVDPQSVEGNVQEQAAVQAAG